MAELEENEQDTYTDASGGTPNTDPVILDARGEASVWLDARLSYKSVLKTALDATLYTEDNVQGGGNATQVFYTPSGTDATSRSVHYELDTHIISSLRFMSEVQRNDVLGHVGSVDVHAPLQKWLDYLMTHEASGLWVAGDYLHGDTLMIEGGGITLIGQGRNTRLLRTIRE